MLSDEVTIEVLQGHFGHGDPLFGVVTHGGVRGLAGHCHALPETIKRAKSCLLCILQCTSALLKHVSCYGNLRFPTSKNTKL